MSQLQAEYVKRGYWVNLKEGPIMGQTITTDVRTGNLVVALLAVLTTFGLGHLWDILIFCYHQIRARGKIADGHFYHQQALLRTLPAPNALASSWIKLWWTWRRKSDGAFARTWALAVLSVAFTALTVIVGIFVSYVISNTDIEVLVKSPICGPIDIDHYISTFPNTFGFYDYIANVKKISRLQSQECDTNATILPAQCSRYTRPSIPFTKMRESCPFSNMCSNISQPGIAMDSGMIDVNDAFGFNLPASDAVKFRRKNTCAFLETEGRYAVERKTYQPPAQYRFEEIIQLYFGNKNARNSTFSYNYLKANLTQEYSMMQLSAFPNFPEDNSFTPLPELYSTDADLTIGGLLKNFIRYEQPVNDPIFAAHQSTGPNETSVFGVKYYISDFPIAVFTCNTQYQYCMKTANGSDFCTKLQGKTFNASTTEYPGATAVQIATIQLLQTTTSMITTGGMVVTGLKAGDSISTMGTITSLPNDQWLQELLGWESHVWAGYQAMISDYAIGMAARAPGAAEYTRKDLSPAEKKLCASQRMRMSGGFVNINVFALSFIVALTCAFTLIDIVLLRILIYTSAFRGACAPRIDRWIQDGVFHLQRRAYEVQENVTWERLDKEIPVTVDRAELPELERRSTLVGLMMPNVKPGIKERALTWGSGITTRSNTDSLKH